MKILNDTNLNGSFELNEAHKERNRRILEKLAESKRSESRRKVSKEEAYRQYDLIKASSNRRCSTLQTHYFFRSKRDKWNT